MIEMIPLLDGDAPRTYERGRVCSTCPTTLSIYNPASQCASCWPVPQIATSAEQNDAWRQLVELMEDDGSSA